MAGHIIAVIGAKGGVGKSVFAANLAIAYQQDFKQKPLLIDLDMQSLGDQSLINGVNPTKTIVEASKIPPGNLDLKILTPFLTTTASGMCILPAPKDPIIARDLDLDGVSKILKSVPNLFQFTVVDCGSAMDPVVARVLESATAVFVVLTPDLIVVNQTRRLINKLQELLFPQEMFQFVLNRFSQNSIVNPQLIQKQLNRSMLGAIPEEVGVSEGALAKSSPACISSPNSQISRSYHDLVRRIHQNNFLDNLSRLKKPSGSAQKAGLGGAFSGEQARSSNDAWTAVKMRVHKALVDQIDLKKTNTDTRDPKQKAILREKTSKAILDILVQEEGSGVLGSRELKAQMLKEVLDEALGLGPLEDLLSDESVTEIMVNSRDQIYTERAGKPMMSKVTFTSELQMMNVVERIVTPLGRRVDEKVPYVDARLQDGSRVHIIIPPLALRGPTITIRKFPKRRLEVKDLVQYGSMTQEIADFLRACVEAKLNVVVSGGTGSGKTTLLNVLSNFIPASERIITVEDAAELQLGQDHVVRLEARPKNIEGEGEVTIRDLIKNCLRMRPDRIVVGECRSGEALDMLQAMNTGHSGSLTTLHANNPRECISRLETLVMMSGLNLPSKAIRENIASAVNIIIQQSRLSDGTRKITHITEVTGMQGDVISLQDIFLYKQEGLDKKRKILGRFVPTGFIPKFVEEMEAKGMKISRNLFTGKVA